MRLYNSLNLFIVMIFDNSWAEFSVLWYLKCVCYVLLIFYKEGLLGIHVASLEGREFFLFACSLGL
jgi:hypothetical protein